jgi:hypothetical protein
VGASFTWSTDADRDRLADIVQRPDIQAEEYRTVFNAVDVRRGTIGVGWTGAFAFDAALELLTESYHFEELTRYYELSAAHDIMRRGTDRQEVKTGPRLGAVARLLVPLGPGARIRLAGSWQDVGNELEHELTYLSIRNGVPLAEDRIVRVFASAGEEFSFGAALESVGAAGDPGWSAYAWFERERGAWRYYWRRPLSERLATQTDYVTAGGTVRHPGPAGLELLGGVAFEGRRDRERRQRYFDRDDGTLRERSEDDADLRFRYAWGARRAFAAVELLASLRVTVPATDPIASLDIRIPF